MAAFVETTGADLASGIPHQETVSLLEKLVIPLIHFILLGFLPIRRMRRSRRPSFAAGCGQLFIARAEAYHRCGGHAAIRDTLHDGIKLPRAFRAAGFKTDLFDATDLATCRMYRTAREVWLGLAKNAGEALAAPAMIVPMTADPARRAGPARDPAGSRPGLLAPPLPGLATGPCRPRDRRSLLSPPGRRPFASARTCSVRSFTPSESWSWSPSSGSPSSATRSAGPPPGKAALTHHPHRGTEPSSSLMVSSSPPRDVEPTSLP